MRYGQQGCAFRAVHVDLSARPVWYTRLNSLVPAVSYHGSVYTESLDIIRYASAVKIAARDAVHQDIYYT